MRLLSSCTGWVVAALVVCGFGSSLKSASLMPERDIAPASMHSGVSVRVRALPGGSKHILVRSSFRSGTYSISGLTAHFRLKPSAAHMPAQAPVQAYLLLPGVGTVVVSVASDGQATIARVPAHLNESNFARDGVAQPLLNVGLARAKGRHAAPRIVGWMARRGV